MRLQFVLLCIGISSLSIDAYRILGLFPHPARSHFQFFHPILRGLADAGHDVTVISHFPDKDAPSNYKDLNIPGNVLTNGIDLTSDWFVNRRRYGHFYETNFIYDWGRESCLNAYSSDEIQRLKRSDEHFDVILIETFNTDCLMGLAWKLRAPVVALSSCAMMPWHYNRMGNPKIPSYIPSIFMQHSDKMTFSQRIFNFIDTHLMTIFFEHVIDRYTDEILREEFGKDIPSIKELKEQTSLMFVNQHYSLSGSKPLSTSVIEIGGIHIKDPQPIQQKIKEFLDNAVEGVIYVSWGSMIRADTLPIAKKNSLLEAFGTFKEKVLWKWENDTLENKPSNVYTEKWLQQREILCHPNVKVFMTHGGLLGSSEAAHCGVTVVATPMYGDQFLNSAAFVNRGMGAIIHYEDITAETVKEAIAVALDPITQENAKKVSYSFTHRISTPLETAVWWVEHVAETKGATLTRTNSVHLSTFVYYSFDVIITLVFVISLIIFSWIWIFRKMFSKSKIQKLKTN